MKRSIVVMCIAVAILTLSHGPVHAQAVKFGLKGGWNIANMHVSGVDLEGELSSITGYCAGGFVSVGVAEMLAIQPEIFYTRKGAQYEQEGPDVFATWTMNYDYLEVPVLAKLSMPTRGAIKPNLFAGPYMAFHVGAEAKIEWNGQTMEEDIEDVRDPDVGLVVGAGVDLGTGSLTADARYVLGLTDISPEAEEGNMYNRVISFMLGFSF